MTDWTELMERSCDQVSVGPPPMEEMYAGAARRRRRRRSVVAAAASVVVLATGGAAALGGDRGWELPGAADATREPAPVVPPPEGMRWVGLGPVAVAVPQEWGTNELRCGTPVRDTVVVDVDAVPLCLTSRPEGVRSLEIGEGPPPADHEARESILVDGEPVPYEGTRCHAVESPNGPDLAVCEGTLYLLDQGIWVRADSSAGSLEVDALLRSTWILEDQVGVPPYRALAQSEREKSGEAYAALLRSMGLEVEVTTDAVPDVPAGWVVDVSPAPGGVLPRGATVRVSVAE